MADVPRLGPGQTRVWDERAGRFIVVTSLSFTGPRATLSLLGDIERTERP